MKNKKKILSLIACLSLLSSCNKTSPSSSSCSVTTSTPTSIITPSKSNEVLSQELFNKYAITSKNNVNTLTGFKDDIEDEYLNIETLIIPETINDVDLTTLECKNGGTFSKFSKIKKIVIQQNITKINSYSFETTSSPFTCLPNLESIEIKNNPNFYVKGNCLIRNDDNQSPIVCGWKDVIIPTEITSINSYAFSANYNVTSVTLHKDINNIKSNAFKFMYNLNNINLNGNTYFILEEGTNILYQPATDSTTAIVLAAWGDAIVPNGVNTLSVQSQKSLKSIDLTKSTSLTSISTNGFAYTNLEKVFIPKNIKIINTNAFSYMKQLKEIMVAPDNNLFKVEGNCLYSIENKSIIAGYGDVEIPNDINLNGYLRNCQTITSIKLGDNTTLNSGYLFSGINDGREVKDFFKLVDNENNTKYRVKNNCLVSDPDTDKEKVLVALPDENGNIVLPDSAKILDCYFQGDLNKGIGLNSIVFNEGLEEITTLNYNLGYQTNITKINLPSTIKNLTNGLTYVSLFARLDKITEVTIGSDGSNQNNYYSVEGNCLIQKGATPDKDIIVFGYGDVVIPERIKDISNNPFEHNFSITSLTLHNEITNIGRLTFDNINGYLNGYLKDYSSFDTIKFKGSIADFKKVRSTKEDYSFYSNLKAYSDITVIFETEDGVKEYKMSDLETVDE